MALVTPQQVVDFVSPALVDAALDDDGDGFYNDSAMARVIAEAEAIFYGAIRIKYDVPFVEPIDPLAQTVILQIAACQIARRFPQVFREAAKDVCDTAKELLGQLRSGDLVLNHPEAGGGLVEVFDGPGVYSDPVRMPQCLHDVAAWFYRSNG